jgi:hypothetical protein
MTREIHRAGPFVNLVQRCARCGEVLRDYRNAMYPEGQPPPSGFAAGANIEVVRGNPTYSGVTSDPPTCDEQPRDSIEEHGL